MSSQLPTQKRARHQVSHPYALAPSSFHTSPVSPILIDSLSEGSLMPEDHSLPWAGEELAKRGQVLSIDTLPDGVLLEIFDHFIDDSRLAGGLEETQAAWQSLVHVCHRWRHIVFESPRRLDLQLVCTEGTPVRDMLDVWPALPLIILCVVTIRSVDNIIAVLERSDRVYRIHLEHVRSSDMETFLAAMQHPFPELTHLSLWPDDRMPVVPDSFLGGSAPRLQCLELVGTPFPGLPNLLLSATHLVNLRLEDIPHSGYFSPNAMATALSTMTSLEYLRLEFESPVSCPERASRCPPPSTRSVLPVFTKFYFKGVNEYLEDLVACIDAPRLDKLDIKFFNDIIFDTPQFIQFITRAPKLKGFEKAHITLSDGAARIYFSSLTSRSETFEVSISCKGLDWQVSSLEQVCTSCLPPLSMLEDLYFHKSPYSQPDWRGDIDNGLWLELLQPFSGVKNLYLSEEFASCIVPALQELVEGRTADVLPTLENIFLGVLESLGPVEEGIGQFGAARQAAGHPIAVSHWTNEEQSRIYY